MVSNNHDAATAVAVRTVPSLDCLAIEYEAGIGREDIIPSLDEPPEAGRVSTRGEMANR